MAVSYNKLCKILPQNILPDLQARIGFEPFRHFRRVNDCHSLTQETDFPDGADTMAAAMLALKEKERDLIVLRYYSRHTLKAVAEMMGMSYINAKVSHKKALSRL